MSLGEDKAPRSRALRKGAAPGEQAPTSGAVSGADAPRAVHPSYPGADIEHEAERRNARAASSGFVSFDGTAPACGGSLEAGGDLPPVPADDGALPASCRLRGDAVLAPIASIEPGSPAARAGLSPACSIVAVDGQPIHDIIDWRWHASDGAIDLAYVDAEGRPRQMLLERSFGEDWGIEFQGMVFDGVAQCVNACTFCFMRQLPQNMRPSLSVRDDDFRLSFLAGTFVTLTNLDDADIDRIVEQRISPLHVSLQAADAAVRRKLIGRWAPRGIEALERLLAAGIEFHAQVVLVPHANDADVLDDTLAWAWERPGILDVGIVPLGFTKHQSRFDEGFTDPETCRAVLDQVEPFRRRARVERGTPWAFPADEFYLNAWGPAVLDHLPPAGDYPGFELFEDGIGIVRSFADDWRRARDRGAIDSCARALAEADAHVRLVAGRAQEGFLDPLLAPELLASRFRPLYVDNDFFGGNVNVTGLLVGADVAAAVRADAAGQSGGRRILYAVPSVVFNDDGVMLDGMDKGDVEEAAGVSVAVVSCSPLEYFGEIERLALRDASRI